MKTSILFLLFAFCLTTFGADQESLRFRGQEGDRLSLDLVKMVTRHRTEYRDSTCTRAIPYVEEECGNETRYRQQCHWRPGRNECRTDYERQCRNVTRYRRQCRREPDQRNCRNTPPRQICRNGRCRTEPSRRICDTKPGREVCTRVPYQDRECTREPRRVCDWVAGQNVCSQEPYQEWVCRDVTRYRHETYACQEPVQIPYQVEREVKSNVTVSYSDKTSKARAALNFNLSKDGNVRLEIKDRSESKTLIKVKKTINTSDDDGNIESNVEFDVEFMSEEKLLSPIRDGISSVGLSKGALWFTVGKVHLPKKLQVTAKVVRDGFFSSPKTLFNKTINGSDLKLTRANGKSKVTISLSRHGVELKNKKHEIEITVRALIDDDFVNAPAGKKTVKRNLELKPQ